jgi:hypothetical protein
MPEHGSAGFIAKPGFGPASTFICKATLKRREHRAPQLGHRRCTALLLCPKASCWNPFWYADGRINPFALWVMVEQIDPMDLEEQ